MYLYRTNSASGVQLGYQLRKLYFRLDASFIADTENSECAIFTNPSIGAFYSEDWESKIRTYQGLTIGIQKGLWNSFEGISYFINLMTGAEWFVFERKAIYLELGSGTAILTKDGAFEGGTIIGRWLPMSACQALDDQNGIPRRVSRWHQKIRKTGEDVLGALQEAQFPGAGQSLRAPLHVKLFEDPSVVALDRIQGNEEALTDFLI